MSRGISDAEVAFREQFIMQRGLPCRLSLRRNGRWACLDIEPMEGFVHLCTDNVYAEHMERGDPYHVSLGYDIDEALLEELGRRWTGCEVLIEVRRFTANHVAVLTWHGLGADAEAWQAWEAGYGWDPDRVAFGLHINM